MRESAECHYFLKIISTRRARIAKQLAAGATITDIAKAEGIGRTLASKEANSLECRQFLVDLVNAEKEEVERMFYLMLRTIEHGFSARKEYMTKDGQVIYGGADHYARLAAGKHLRELCAAGRPAPKHPEKQEPRLLTLEQLKLIAAGALKPEQDDIDAA